MAIMFIKPPSWVEISKSAFDHNIRVYKDIIGPNRKLAVVIKSNAYGHDTATMAQLCQEQPNIDWICTNSLSEALITRLAGTKPILVISLINEDPALAIEHNIDLIGHSLHQIQELNEIGSTLNKPTFIHLKLDTGMSRLGFLPDKLLSSINQIREMPYIQISGIFSHFAESSKVDQRFTQHQAHCFKDVLGMLKAKGIEIPLRHIANSAGIAATTTLQKTNMVRLGAGAYGLYPSDANIILTKRKHQNFELKPILSWKARVYAIKKVPANSFVGYGRTYKTNRETTIGFLPVGYYEGLDKKLSNRGVVYLPHHEKYAPIIGLISMNITMIDLTYIPNVKETDEAILIGPQKPISAQTIDKYVETENPRQVLAKIALDIPRIIVP